MQLRIYAIEVLTVIVIIWRIIGPASQLVVTDESSSFPGKHLCTFFGINTDFTYLFIPAFCFELLLFFLAITSRVSLNNMRERKATPGTSSLRTVIGTRMVIDFKEHCSHRLSSEPIMIVGEESARQVTNHDQSNEGDEEMQPVKSDEESTEVITYEEL
ncbi:uncharacterized protein F5147DRAFT_699467 [Suillus discolor]|uniref:Uncharacterized protein n=1 Tax=Suillus discolor TaxID=1912936 RepID=A0A9P7JTB6_9AGAM|nr:uncharacterized protein F5147DRAFT_699467 [Suillus discolor]KAG2107063.1 hypothetical protein F5147DRAFT_699467 [Suillus discolor]